MKRLVLKVLAVFLSVLMIVFTLPLEAIASELQGTLSDSDTASEEQASCTIGGNAESTEPIPGVIYEVTELRGENIKQFHLADGSYIAVSYIPYTYTIGRKHRSLIKYLKDELGWH